MDREQIDMLLMVDDDEDPTSLVRELFTLFREESDEKLAGLSAVCNANDAASLRKIVHFVAGSAGNLGLSRLSAFYRAIECAIDEGKLTDLTHCEAPILREYENACEAFCRELKV